MSVFNSNDIRGVFNEDWDSGTAYRIGLHLGDIIDARKIGVGRDSRLSSDVLFDALTEGLTNSGVDVYDIGLCDTPALYFAVSNYNLDGGVMITASHNPPEYNGLKIVGKGSRPIGYRDGIAELEKLSNAKDPVATKVRIKGKKQKLDIEKDYLDFYRKYFENLGNLRIVVDCSGGTAGVFGKEILSNISNAYSLINEVPDGNFTCHGPNPMLESNLEELKKEVLRWKGDVGLCFDGDADRVVFIDEKGNTVSPDLIIAILAKYFLSGGKQTILYDLRCSNGIAEYISECGGSAVMCPVGHTGIKKLLRATGAVFGGELAGHYYFKDYFFSDSAWLTAILVLNVLRKTKESLSEISRKIQRYSYSGEINFAVDERIDIFSLLENRFSEGAFTKMDGLRVDYPDWWFVVRKSTNEPLVRLVVEARNSEALKARVAELSRLITGEKT